MTLYGMGRQEALWGTPMVTGVSLISIANERSREDDGSTGCLDDFPALCDKRMAQYGSA